MRKIMLQLLVPILIFSATAKALENENEVIVRVKGHLQSAFEPERSAALYVLAAVNTEEAARTALTYFKGQQYANSEDLKVCIKLFALLPVDELIKLSQFKNDPLARAASEALAQTPPEKIQALVKDLAEKPEDNARRAAAEIVLQLGSGGYEKNARDAKGRMIDAGDDARRRMVADLAWVFTRSPDAYQRISGLRSTEYLKSLTEELARTFMRDKDPSVRSCLPDVLINNLEEPIYPWSVSLLLELAQDKDTDVRGMAIKSIQQTSHKWSDKERKAAAEVMKAALGDSFGYSRVRAIQFFIQNYDPEVLPLIEKMTTDPATAVAVMALQATQKLKSPRVADLAFAATQITPAPARDPKGQPNWDAIEAGREIRVNGLKILAALNDRRTASVATKLAADADWDVAKAARDILARSGTADLATVKAVGLTKAPASAMKDTVLRTLSLDPAQRLAELESIYKGLDANQKQIFLRHLNQSSDESGSDLADQFLVNRLKDPDPAARVAALRNLTGRIVPYSHIPSRPEGALEAIELLDDKTPAVAQAAAQLLNQLPYRSLTRLTTKHLLGGFEDSLNELYFVGKAASMDRETLIQSLKHKNHNVRSSARNLIKPEHWDQADVCLAILEGVERVNELPPGAPSSPVLIQQILQAAQKNPARCAAHFALIARIDDDQADAVLKASTRSPDRAIRWAALDALVARGDESDATLDHALARLLTSENQNERAFFTWPVVGPRLLERLETFKTLYKPERIEKVRAEIQRKIKDIEAYGGPAR